GERDLLHRRSQAALAFDDGGEETRAVNFRIAQGPYQSVFDGPPIHTGYLRGFREVLALRCDGGDAVLRCVDGRGIGVRILLNVAQITDRFVEAHVVGGADGAFRHLRVALEVPRVSGIGDDRRVAGG